MTIQAVLYIIAIVLFVAAAFVEHIGRAALLPLAFAFALAAFATPVLIH